MGVGVVPEAPGALACVIPGCKDVRQVESNAAAASLDLVRTDHPLAFA